MITSQSKNSYFSREQNVFNFSSFFFDRSLLASKSIELPTPNASTAAAQAGVSGVGGGGVTLAIDPTLAAMGWDLDWDLSTDWEKMLIGNGGGKAEEGWEGDLNFSSGVEEGESSL